MLQLSSEELFFTYVDSEEAREGIRWPTPPPLEELVKRLGDFRAHLGQQRLSPIELQAALDTYEGYLLVKYAFSGLPHAPTPTTAH